MLAAKYWIAESKKQRFPRAKSGSPPLRIADFFSGCGGMTLGALIGCMKSNRALEIGLAADVWGDALGVYRKNFSRFLGASTDVDLFRSVSFPGSLQLSDAGRELSVLAGELDVIMAGPPCQGHSDLNNSSRRTDPRNLLYTIPVAFALQTRPKILLVENVPTVVHASGNVVSAALLALQDSGYVVAELVANIQDFGLPQTRKRHFLVASRVHSSQQLDLLLRKIKSRDKDVALWPFISDLEFENEDSERLITKRSRISDENQSRMGYLFENSVFDLPDALRPACHRDKAHSYVSMYGRLRTDRPAQTITSGFGSMGQGRFIHPTQRRMITAHEAARIQGFPDYFDFDSVRKITALREMIGNAVPPAVSAALVSLLMPPA